MPFVREATGTTIEWKRPHFFATNYQLWMGERLLATLNRAGMLKQHAIGEAEGQQWTFQREGLMGRKLVIYPGPAKQVLNEPARPLASIQPGWSRTGELQFHDGRVYSWMRNGNWRPVWSWVGPGNKTLLSIKKGRLLEIAPAASDLPDLALLSLFGLYLILVMEADDASSAAAAASVSV